MPTSPLPSSTKNSGVEWPGSFTSSNEQVGGPQCLERGQITNTDIKNVLLENEQETSKRSSGKLRVNISGKTTKKNQNTSTVELHPLLREGGEERSVLHSAESTNSGYKVFFTDQGRGQTARSETTANTQFNRCVNCAERQTDNVNNTSNGTQNICVQNVLEENRKNLKVVKKKHKGNTCRGKFRKYLKCLIGAIALIVISSVVTYFVLSGVRKHRHDDSGNFPNSKKNQSEFLVKIGPYIVDRSGHFYPGLDSTSEKQLSKLSGIYAVLDKGSLKGKNELLKWKNSTKKQFESINHGIIYSDGLFYIQKTAWYIVYSKLNLVTYQKYKDGNVTMELHTYLHCVVIETHKEDSVCNSGAQWGGWRGPSQIWSPAYLKKGTMVKVTMRNKDLLAYDSESNLVTIIELEQDE